MNNNVIFCRRCLYSNQHPLKITFNEQGVCSGCSVHSEKYKLDWKYRINKLIKIVKDYKSKNNNYDCIVPVSGAGDSYFVLHVVKNILKLNPILVTYNKFFNTRIGINNLSNLRTRFDSDIIFKNVNPVSVKKIIRHTYKKFGSIYWHCIAGQTVFPVQIASKIKVPLIIWGAHQGIEQTGMFSHTHEVEMTRRYRKDHDLLGHEAEDLLDIESDLKYNDIHNYIYPTDQDIKSNGTKGIYLSNYIPWDPKAQHEKMIKYYKYKTSKLNRTFDCYDNVDCYVYNDLHDYIKINKLGYSKVTDHATREIRHGRLGRDEAIFLVKSYERKKIKYFGLFSEWLGISNSSKDFLFNTFKNHTFWQRRNMTNYKFNGLSKQLKINTKNKKNFLHFECNSTLNLGYKDKYIVFGKGTDQQL
jgi:N-acetyl sugar amidotransferase